MTTRVKICGLCRQDDVDACIAAGADFIGFIFVEGSPRAVKPSEIARIETGGAKRIGVFIDRPIREVRNIMKEARLDFAQLHGREPPEYAKELGPERVIKVFWPLGETERELEYRMGLYADSVAHFLFDAGKSGGGHGLALPMERLRLLKSGSPRPFFVAGGLGAGNAGMVVREIEPFGIDMNSALESFPGRKDARKVKEAIDSLRRTKI